MSLKERKHFPPSPTSLNGRHQKISFGEKRNGDSVAVADLSVQKVEFWFPALFLTWLCCKTADHSCQGQKYINTDQTEDNDD